MAKKEDSIPVAIVTAGVSRLAGGLLPIMQAHAKELTSRGYDVSVYGVADTYSDTDRPSWGHANLSIHKPLWRKAGVAPTFQAALDKGKPKIIHQHGIWMNPSRIVMKHIDNFNSAKVISVHGSLEPWCLENSAIRKSIVSALFEYKNLTTADCIHCSESEVEGVRRYGIKNPVAVLPNGVNLPIAAPSTMRPSWLPNDEKRTLLFLGRIHRKKGIQETLDAWHMLAGLRPDVVRNWRLVFVGWDDRSSSDELRARAQQHVGLEILFPGPIHGDEKRAVLEHSDAFILASHSEGLPISVLEAWSYGLPVFMSGHCNLSAAFEKNAAIEVPTNPLGIAEALANGLTRGDLVEVGENGRRRAAELFSWPIIGAQLDELYRWILNRGGRPPFVALA